MPKARVDWKFFIASLTLLMAGPSLVANAQMGGMGGQPGGGGGPAPPPGLQKPRFRDHVMQQGGPRLQRETGDKLVKDVKIVGNKQIGSDRIMQLIRTRPQGFYNPSTVLSDIRSLYDFRAFQKVDDRVEPQPDGSVVVTFIVEEYPLVSQVVYHGNYRVNDRDLIGRSGISKGDPINESAIESTRRRLEDYYREQGFNQIAIDAIQGYQGNPAKKLPPDPNAVVFRINEGEKERILDINFVGNTIVSTSRLKKVVEARGPFMGIGTYIGNVANLKQIDQDVTTLTNYYQSLGYVMAEVDRVIEYDTTLKWVTVTFIIDEGPQYSVNEIRVVGNQFIDTSSLRDKLLLKEGQPFNQVDMNTDVSEIEYAYGSIGFIYAEVTAELRLIGEENKIDVIYQIEEGDRWKVGEIFVEIGGEPNLMRESTMLNLLDLVEGQYIDRRKLEMNRRLLMRSELLETNPAIADPPGLKLVPRDENGLGGSR